MQSFLTKMWSIHLESVGMSSLLWMAIFFSSLNLFVLLLFIIANVFEPFIDFSFLFIHH